MMSRTFFFMTGSRLGGTLRAGIITIVPHRRAERRKPPGALSTRRLTPLGSPKVWDQPVNVVIEFYGIPRQRAGRAELTVCADTPAEALAGVERACPDLHGLLEGGRLVKHFRLSVDGKHFVTDLQQPLEEGTRLLLLSADAGG
jgi:hypothetical protein